MPLLSCVTISFLYSFDRSHEHFPALLGNSSTDSRDRSSYGSLYDYLFGQNDTIIEGDEEDTDGDEEMVVLRTAQSNPETKVKSSLEMLSRSNAGLYVSDMSANNR